MKQIVLFAGTLFLSLSLCNAQEMLVDCEIISDAEYPVLASKAAELGATHLHCTSVEPSMWQWDEDRTDPYPNWSLLRPSVFKLYVPEALKPYIPADYAKKNLERLKKRVEVLRKYGLQPVYSGFDPAYLPTKAYVDHPEWRGPRCDQSRRARKAYYAPCIDNPQMRAMFVEAITEICKAVPFQKFDVLVNDSGSGLCWYPYLYPGANGPEACQDKPIQDRIVDFLSMYQEGARNAGVNDPKVNLARYLRDDVISVTMPNLKEGQFLLNKGKNGGEGYAIVGFPSYYDNFFPVCQMPRVAYIAAQLQKIQSKPSKNMEIGLRGIDETDAFRFLKKYLREPIGPKASDLEKALEWLATGFVGEAGSDKLVEIWNDIEDLNLIFAPFNTGGHLFRLATVHQRWLTRPLVVYPKELKGEDRDYWRNYIFQAGSEDDAMDLTMLQGHKWLGGYGGYHSIWYSARQARSILKKDIALSAKLESMAVDAESQKYIRGLNLKLRFFRLIVENAVNVVEFQYMLDELKAFKGYMKQSDKTLMIPYQGDKRYPRMCQIIRNEIDNCSALIALLEEAEKAGQRIAVCSENEKTQTIMLLSPNLKKDLKRKMKIMEEKSGDVDKILMSPNI